MRKRVRRVRRRMWSAAYRLGGVAITVLFLCVLAGAVLWAGGESAAALTVISRGVRGSVALLALGMLCGWLGISDDGDDDDGDEPEDPPEPPPDVGKALEMRGQGATWTVIATEMGVNRERIKRRTEEWVA